MKRKNKNFMKIAILALFILFFSLLGRTNFIHSAIEDSGTNYTRAEVVVELNNSWGLIQEMKNNNFSIGYVNDTFIDALKVLKQVDYAEILRGKMNATDLEKFNAQNALSLIDWTDLNYGDVLNYTEEIQSRRNQAFEIYDSLTVLKMEIKKYENKGINLSESWNLFNQANDSFYADRYGEAKDLIDQTRTNIDNVTSELSSFGQFKKYAILFIKREWYVILATLIILGGLSYQFSKGIRKNRIKEKIKRMQIELESIHNLEKKTQTERFKENKISGLTYNIRMKKYEERTNWIKEEIPVLEAKLRKFKR